ncbi:hypothetical protein [Flectobacillus longus]|uniref:hypothetical protein n=1 Tax=Flectobacillus longus TaxID=2984207 RepID=UPI0024B825A0|nr:hypothetical protein [Flectobacillus longus]MDI9879897.1 hypothetical protein [Flectobacillus longus]
MNKATSLQTPRTIQEFARTFMAFSQGSEVNIKHLGGGFWECEFTVYQQFNWGDPSHWNSVKDWPSELYSYAFFSDYIWNPQCNSFQRIHTIGFNFQIQ